MTNSVVLRNNRKLDIGLVSKRDKKAWHERVKRQEIGLISTRNIDTRLTCTIEYTADKKRLVSTTNIDIGLDLPRACKANITTAKKGDPHFCFWRVHFYIVFIFWAPIDRA